MRLIYHPLAARDAREIAGRYAAISDPLVERFWREIDRAISAITSRPASHPFDASCYRRCNLRKFPYHILFEEHAAKVRVIVIRHHQRNPHYGLQRI